MSDHNQFFKKAQETFLNELEKIKGITKTPTILILGYTGIGKTSLVQHILGKGIVDDSKIKHASRGTSGFVEYSDEFITIIDSMGFEPNINEELFIHMTKALIQDRQKRENIQEHIHLVWYCIAAVNARVTSTDIKLIEEISKYCKLQIVITKSEVARAKQKEEILKELLNNGLQNENITFVSVPDPDDSIASKQINEGVKELVDKSLSLLPEAYKASFLSKQIINLEYKRKQAADFIDKRAFATGWVGIIPFTDIPIIVPMQIEMIARLSNIYGFEIALSKRLIGASAIATIVTALTANSMLDYFPGIGQLLSGAATFAITKSIGYLTSDYLMQCSKDIIDGKDISQLKPYNLDNLKEYFLKFNK